MKKFVVLIMVLGLASCLQAGVWPSPKAGPAINYPGEPGVLSVTVIGMQDEYGSAYIVYLETTDEGQQWMSPASDLRYLPASNTVIVPEDYNSATHASIIRLLPEPMTILSLGLAGLLWGRRINVRSLPLRILQRY